MIIFRGTRAELLVILRQVPGIIAGKKPDPTGMVTKLLVSVGTKFLEKLSKAYDTKSEGGTDEMGVLWPPLSPVTLALRHKRSGPKIAEKMRREFEKLPKYRQSLVHYHYEKLYELYRGGRGTPGAAARRHARHLLELIRPVISPTRYEKLRKELDNPLKEKQAKQKALIGAHGLILRDTGRLFRSLSPETATPDRILAVGRGTISVGSNVKVPSGINLLTLHDSSRPRKKKRDGTDKLPRRQILPDRGRPIPGAWWNAMYQTLGHGLQRPEFWLKLLGSKAHLA